MFVSAPGYEGFWDFIVEYLKGFNHKRKDFEVG